MTTRMQPHRDRQTGAALVTSMVMLLILTILGIAAIGTSTLEEKMAGNTQEAMRAFEAAESGISRALTNPDVLAVTLPTVYPPPDQDPYTFGGGRSGSARITVTPLQRTPVRRGSGESAIKGYQAHFDFRSAGSTITNANAIVRQGIVRLQPNDGTTASQTN